MDRFFVVRQFCAIRRFRYGELAQNCANGFFWLGDRPAKRGPKCANYLPPPKGGGGRIIGPSIYPSSDFGVANWRKYLSSDGLRNSFGRIERNCANAQTPGAEPLFQRLFQLRVAGNGSVQGSAGCNRRDHLHTLHALACATPMQPRFDPAMFDLRTAARLPLERRQRQRGRSRRAVLALLVGRQGDRPGDDCEHDCVIASLNAGKG
jgi:hypothetical protein